MFFEGLLNNEGDLNHDEPLLDGEETDELVMMFLQACTEIDVENEPIEIQDMVKSQVN